MLQAQLDRVLELATSEARNYGDGTPLFNQIDQLWRELGGGEEPNPLIKFKAWRLRVHSEPISSDISKRDLVEYIDISNRKIDEIVKRQHTLGRRCVNKRDFGDAGSIFEARDAKSEMDVVKPEDFIRLKNGVCWNINSLMQFIEFQRGHNSIIDIDTGRRVKGFENYPDAETIWSDKNELERILDHPASIASNFRADLSALMNVNYGNIGDYVTIETLDLMEKTGRLLAGEGEIFIEELDKLLDAKQRAAWKASKFNIERVGNPETQREICFSIGVTLKSNALADWRAHWATLSQKTRDVFDTVKPNFTRDMNECLEGRLCVFVSTNILFNARNAIARLKKLPEIRRMSEGLEPAAICKGISERVMSQADARERAELDDLQRQFGGPMGGLLDQMFGPERAAQLRELAPGRTDEEIAGRIAAQIANGGGLERMRRLQALLIEAEDGIIELAEMGADQDIIDELDEDLNAIAPNAPNAEARLREVLASIRGIRASMQ